LLVALLFIVEFWQVSERVVPGPAALMALTALAAGLAASLAYAKAAWARSLVTYASPVVLISPLLFLTSAPISTFLSPSQTDEYKVISKGNELPTILMILFDELPLVSLLDEERRIDRVRYPNFARLAESSTWYREASSVSSFTREALPAIVTGSYMHKYLERLNSQIEGRPDATEFPSNLFSLLETTHEIIAIESLSQFAPAHPATVRYVPRLGKRLPSLLRDSLVIAGHVISPKALGDKLPPLVGQWSDFLGERPTGAAAVPATDWAYEGKEPDKVKSFIELIQKRTVPTFYFLHALLPHNPYKYNERGQRHREKMFRKQGKVKAVTGVNSWPDEEAANRGYQAHLLQLTFTDRLLGHILDRLAAVDLLDQSLLVLASDHGITFYWDRTGLPQQELERIQASEILYVPLFIKAPHQREGEVSDQLVQLVDIVPTLADMLQIQIPWEVDGVSALQTKEGARRRTGRFPKPVEFDPVIDPEHRALKRKIELFGSQDVQSIYAVGPYKEIINAPTGSFPLSKSTLDAKLQFESPGMYRNMDPARPFLPAYVEGTLEDYRDPRQPTGLTLAIAVNGFIRALSRVSEDDGKLRFMTRVSPESLIRGNNEITVHAVVPATKGEPLSLMDFSQAREE
jgi:hypothetical protein